MDNEEVESEVDEDPYDDENAVENIIFDLADVDGPFQSPINLNIAEALLVDLPDLIWNNYELVPKKVKASNTGHTLIISAKWHIERPYLQHGPLLGNYVFSQMHFHWGKNCMEGSEHTVDGVQMPMEMHLVHFKTAYLTQESALREKDGVVIVVYFFMLQEGANPMLNVLVEATRAVKEPHSSAKITPTALTDVIKCFGQDYLCYWGSVLTATCGHLIFWIISRRSIGISSEQVDEFRQLLDVNGDPLQSNFREVQPKLNRKVFHVGASGFRSATLLGIHLSDDLLAEQSEAFVTKPQ